ncbi:hypothetical protein C2E23DRAFT_722528 [Lenzites betulinus]|nr:hypothetical protein C2E23DRAFT_722528 [Lenzites betulinus]
MVEVLKTTTEVLITLVKVSRPVGWVFGPILYEIGVIHAPGGPRAGHPAIWLQLLSFSFPLALVVFGVNDVYDYATDLRNPRKLADGLEGTVLPPAQHTPVLIAAALATLLILFFARPLRPPQNALVTAALLALAWGYSAPPLRFKERPGLDSLSNGAIVVLAYLAGYTACGGALRRPPAKGLALGLCAAGVHALGAAVDAEVDAAAGQRTIATAYGVRGAVGLGVVCYLVAVGAAERKFTSVFGVYLLGGLGIMLYAWQDTARVYLAFRLVVYWTVGMPALWFAGIAYTVTRPHYVVC